MNIPQTPINILANEFGQITAIGYYNHCIGITLNEYPPDAIQKACTGKYLFINNTLVLNTDYIETTPVPVENNDLPILTIIEQPLDENPI